MVVERQQIAGVYMPDLPRGRRRARTSSTSASLKQLLLRDEVLHAEQLVAIGPEKLRIITRLCGQLFEFVERVFVPTLGEDSLSRDEFEAFASYQASW